MRAILDHRIGSLATLALAFALAAGAVVAQEPVPEAPACTATVEPLEVAIGQAAVRITATLSEAIGEVNALEAPEGSGVALAEPGQIPRADMAADEEAEAPRPIEMAAEADNSVSLWLTTAEATPGEHLLTLKSEAGQCNALVTVKPEG